MDEQPSSSTSGTVRTEDDRQGAPEDQQKLLSSAAKQVGLDDNIVSCTYKNQDEVETQTDEEPVREHEAHGERQCFHGFSYLIKLLVLFIYKFYKKKIHFEIATAYKPADKFDDIYVKYKKSDIESVQLCIQAKHVKDNEKYICVSDLLPEKFKKDAKGKYTDNRPFNLNMYLDSYYKLKKDPEFNVNEKHNQTFGLMSNLKLNFNDLKSDSLLLPKDCFDVQVNEILDVKFSKFKTGPEVREPLVIYFQKHSKYSVQEINEFLDNFVIIDSQPSEVDLTNVIMKEIEQDFNPFYAKSMNAELHLWVEKWWNDKKGTFKTSKIVSKFITTVKNKLLGSINFQFDEPSCTFHSRKRELMQLKDFVVSRKQKNKHIIDACVIGIAGVGKSELIRKYAMENKNDFNNLIWINAESKESTENSFRDLYEHLLLGKKEAKVDMSIILNTVYGYLRGKKVLLVFDNSLCYSNVRQLFGISKYLPNMKSEDLKIIVTSQSKDWSSNINILCLESFNELESVEFLKENLQQNKEGNEMDYKALASMLQGLPLALRMAVSYVLDRKQKLKLFGEEYSVKKFIDEYNESPTTYLESDLLDDKHHRPVSVIWNMAFKIIKESSCGNLAVDLIHLFTYIGPDNIHPYLITSFINGDNSEHEKMNALQLIHSFSLISISGNKVISMHCLVQKVAAKEFRCIEVTANNIKTLQSIAEVLMLQGNYPKCLTILRKIFTFQKNKYTMNHRSTLDTLHRIGKVCECLGKYKVALNTYNEVYEKQVTLLGEDNLSTLTTLHNIAVVYERQGKYELALNTYNKVYEKKILLLGEDNQSTLTTLHNIAVVYERMGKYKEALNTYKKVYEKQVALLGEDNPRTLETLPNIEVVYRRLGKYKEALNTSNKLNEKKLPLLVEDNPSTLPTLNNFAYLYERQGKYEEAMNTNIIVYEKKVLLFGEDNPSTLDTLHNIAGVYEMQGNYKAALTTYNKVYEKRILLLGEDNPSTLTTLHNIAVVYERQGKYEEALTTYNKVYEKRVLLLGEDDPSALETLHNIAGVYERQGNYEEALNTNNKVYEKRVLLLGGDNQSTLDTLHNIAVVYERQGKYEEALTTYNKVYEKRVLLLGEDDPSALETLHNIAGVYERQGNYEEALNTYNKVYEKRVLLLGEDNPSTLDTLNKIAVVYEMQGKYEEALNTYNKLYEKKVLLLGEDDPSTLDTLNNIAVVYERQGNYEEALNTYSKLYEKRVLLLGEEGPPVRRR